MTQSRRSSLVESVTNILIGYVVAVFAQAAIFPMFGVYVSVSDNMLIGAMFTVISLVRSYCLRRLFNRLSVRGKR